MSSFSRTVANTEATRLDRWLAAILLTGGFLLRLLYVWHFRIDSDEPQHLHVVWAWANGLLPYRDVFDNHAPVFQALSAPLFHLLGIRADILLPMRAAMLPILGLTIICVWKIAATLFSPRIALWTAVLAAFYPPFFFTSIEYRPDQLWALLWLITLTVFVTGRATPRRALVAGLLLGLAFSVSMKTTLFLLTLTFALGGALLVRRAAGGTAPDRRTLLRCAGAGLLGITVIPALVVLYFVLHGAGREMYYCVIQHNVLPQERHLSPFIRSTLHWLLWMPIAVIGCWIITRLPQTVAIRTRTAFTFLAGVLFYQTLVWYWPILTDEDYLPFFPAMMITAAPAALWLASRITQLVKLPAPILPTLFAVGELVFIVTNDPPLEDHTTDKIGIVADTLKLTAPTDFVMDAKGETIYRQRASGYVMEALTVHRLRRGLLEDNIAERLTATRTPMLSSRRMTSSAHEFIRANYVPIAFRLKVLGKVICEEDQAPENPCSFDIAIPARYTIVTVSGTPSGTIDGTPFTGPRELTAGHHEFRPTGTPERAMLVWANAIERGYSPFTQIKKDYTTAQD